MRTGVCACGADVCTFLFAASLAFRKQEPGRAGPVGVAPGRGRPRAQCGRLLLPHVRGVSVCVCTQALATPSWHACLYGHVHWLRWGGRGGLPELKEALRGQEAEGVRPGASESPCSPLVIMDRCEGREGGRQGWKGAGAGRSPPGPQGSLGICRRCSTVPSPAPILPAADETGVSPGRRHYFLRVGVRCPEG